MSQNLMESTTRVKVAKFMEFIEFHNIQFEKGAEKVSRKEFVWPRMGKKRGQWGCLSPKLRCACPILKRGRLNSLRTYHKLIERATYTHKKTRSINNTMQ